MVLGLRETFWYYIRSFLVRNTWGDSWKFTVSVATLITFSMRKANERKNITEGG